MEIKFIEKKISMISFMKDDNGLTLLEDFFALGTAKSIPNDKLTELSNDPILQ